MAPHKRSRHEEEAELIGIEGVSSSLRHDHSTQRQYQRKKTRLSTDENPRARHARDRASSVSSSDEDDIPDAESEEATAFPPSTQYEILRDNGFKHLENPDLDDLRATQAFNARKQQIGDNHAADNAIIQEITCINFMCHERLHVELGPLINFVVGLNGSGKSAVLTAITLCLGGKTASTNRGASLKSLIKTGCDSASLIVKLKNEGNDAYQPDVYGDSIIIERHFSRTGSSGYKVKSAMGRLISSKKGDVDDIVEYYQLQVDNPMNVLTQDAAKSFITSSTPAQKYKFFVEGVQLEALDNDYKLILDTCDQIEAKLRESRDDIKILEKKAETAEAKSRIAMEHENMRSEHQRLGKQLVWAQVVEEEENLVIKERLTTECQEKIETAERNVEEKDFAFQRTEELLERARESERQLGEEFVPLREEEEAAKSANDLVTKELQNAHEQQRAIKASLSASQQKVTSFQRDIAEELNRMEAANGGAHSRKLVEIQGTEKVAAEAKGALQQNIDQLPALQENLRVAEDALAQMKNPLLAKHRELEAAQERLSALNLDRGNVMSGFDPKMPRLLKTIRDDRGFRETPIGPIGLHIKLLKPMWSSILETTIGTVLTSFVVSNKPDQTRLSSILRDAGMSYCQVYISNSEPLNVTSHEPESQYDTILRVLDIDNELVRNTLVINQAIEQSILIPDRSNGVQIMFGGPKPRNVKQCFCIQEKRGWGFRLGYTGRNNQNQEISPVYPPKGKPRMKTDIESQISYQKETINQLGREKSDLEMQNRQAQGNVQRCQQAITQHKRDHGRLKIDLQRVQDKVERLQVELDQFSVEEGKLDGLHLALTDAQRGLAIDQDTYGNLGLEKEKLNQKSKETKNMLLAVKERLADHEAKLKKVQLKIRNIEQARKHALAEKNIAISQVEDFRREKERAQQKHGQQAERVANWIEQANKLCTRVPLDPGVTQASMEAKYAKLKQQLKTYEKKQGGTDKEIHDAATEAKQIYETAKSYQKELNELLALLKLSFKTRVEMFRRFQQFISARSRINFNYLLSERAFRGKLTIDHKARLLDVHVEPDETTKSSKGRQTKTLSGGEKSFSSICLLLSLWEAMGAPLRCLDEFDVFMDDVNRDVSTKMIISAARRSVGRQFILITPKALGAGVAEGEKDVKMHKLLDPREKNQRRIDEMVQDE